MYIILVMRILIYIYVYVFVRCICGSLRAVRILRMRVLTYKLVSCRPVQSVGKRQRLVRKVSHRLEKNSVSGLLGTKPFRVKSPGDTKHGRFPESVFRSGTRCERIERQRDATAGTTAGKKAPVGGYRGDAKHGPTHDLLAVATRRAWRIAFVVTFTLSTVRRVRQKPARRRGRPRRRGAVRRRRARRRWLSSLAEGGGTRGHARAGFPQRKRWRGRCWRQPLRPAYTTAAVCVRPTLLAPLAPTLHRLRASTRTPACDRVHATYAATTTAVATATDTVVTPRPTAFHGF